RVLEQPIATEAEHRRDLGRHPVVVDRVADAGADARGREVEQQAQVDSHRLLAISLVGPHPQHGVDAQPLPLDGDPRNGARSYTTAAPAVLDRARTHATRLLLPLPGRAAERGAGLLPARPHRR